MDRALDTFPGFAWVLGGICVYLVGGLDAVGHAQPTSESAQDDLGGQDQSLQLRLADLEPDLWSYALPAGAGGSGLANLVIGLARDDRAELSAVPRYLYGGILVLRAVLALALMPSSVEALAALEAMPREGESSLERRVVFQERHLERLAEEGRTARYVDGGLALGAALSFVALDVVPRGFQDYDVADGLLLVSATATLILGILQLAIPSEAEDLWESWTRFGSG